MKGFCLEVSGDFACFTRPEMKVERVSYDVITPSAARSIFSAIFWKPEIAWRVTRIEVLNPIKWTNIRRNEVSEVASEKKSGIYVEDARQQRAGLLLKDVRYRLTAEFDCVNPTVDPAKYAAMFDRRASKGQYFMHPYLGCREFSCKTIRLVKDLANEPKPIPETRDFGFMLFDMDYSDSKNIRPMFYRPKMVEGVINVPHPNSEEVVK